MDSGCVSVLQCREGLASDGGRGVRFVIWEKTPNKKANGVDTGQLQSMSCILYQQFLKYTTNCESPPNHVFILTLRFWVFAFSLC